MRKHPWRSLLAFVLLCSLSHGEESREVVDVVQHSQKLLGQGEYLQSEQALVELEKKNPEVKTSLLFCYQRFFVAIHGRGDRVVARDVFLRLTHLVAEGKIDPTKNEYLSVNQVWYQLLTSTDSDLPRIANQHRRAYLAYKKSLGY